MEQIVWRDLANALLAACGGKVTFVVRQWLVEVPCEKVGLFDVWYIDAWMVLEEVVEGRRTSFLRPNAQEIREPRRAGESPAYEIAEVLQEVRTLRSPC
jgi:hypothetical protein